MSRPNSSKPKKNNKQDILDARREELFSVMPANRWFTFYIDFCYVMTLQEALFFQFLMNKFCTADPSDVDSDKFFRCTVEFLNYPPMNWTEDLQRKLVPALEKKKFVRKKVVGGMPPQRWIYLNITEVMDAIKKAKENEAEPPKKRWRTATAKA